MKKIVIAPVSKKLRNGKENPKNYAHWPTVIAALKKKGYYLIQIGGVGDPNFGCDEFHEGRHLSEVRGIVERCDAWVSIESFLMHFARLLNKPGVVIWHVCKPELYGYKENINLYKDKKYFRPNQFDVFESTPYNAEAHVDPKDVVAALVRLLN